MRKIVVSLVLAALAWPAIAFTDCTSLVKAVAVETGHKDAGYVVTLDSGLSVAVSPTSENSRELMGLVLASQRFGEAVTMRFTGDAVDCNRAARRSDLIMVTSNREETSTTTVGGSTTTTVAPVPR